MIQLFRIYCLVRKMGDAYAHTVQLWCFEDEQIFFAVQQAQKQTNFH